MSDTREIGNGRLYVPALGKLYALLDDYAETALRVVAGLTLVTHGWPKIQNPTGTSGMIEQMGFYPAALWAVLLACTEFFGGLLVAVGLFTRPAAFAAFLGLLGAASFHWFVLDQGFQGAELPIIWAFVMLFFAVRGGNAHSVDTRLGRQF